MSVCAAPGYEALATGGTVVLDGAEVVTGGWLLLVVTGGAELVWTGDEVVTGGAELVVTGGGDELVTAQLPASLVSLSVSIRFGP